MKITILDGYTENPGDLSWDGVARFGNLKIFDRTSLTDEQRHVFIDERCRALPYCEK